MNLFNKKPLDDSVYIEKIKKNVLYYKEAPENIKNNKEIALVVVQIDPWMISEIPYTLRNDRDIVLESIKKSPKSYLLTEKLYNQDLEVMKILVEGDPTMFMFASCDLRKNPDFCYQAIQQNPDNVRHIEPPLLEDDFFVISLLKNNVQLFHQLRRKNDEDLLIKMVKEDIDLSGLEIPEFHYSKRIVKSLVRLNSDLVSMSRIEGYQTMKDIVKKEGESFLFSCFPNTNKELNKKIMQNERFLPTVEQIEMGSHLQDKELQQIYMQNKELWLLKHEAIRFIEELKTIDDITKLDLNKRFNKIK